MNIQKQEKALDEKSGINLLIEMFECTSFEVKMNCTACGNKYGVKVYREGICCDDISSLCCIFCGHQVKLY